MNMNQKNEKEKKTCFQFEEVMKIRRDNMSHKRKGPLWFTCMERMELEDKTDGARINIRDSDILRHCIHRYLNSHLSQ